MKAAAKRIKITTVRKWGNGYGVLLPKAFVDELSLKSAELKTEMRGSSVIFTKVAKPKKVTLEDLVRGIHKRNRHKLVDFGKPQGKEIW
jgi:antitoxin component of MazEF toxin-antitoxin module